MNQIMGALINALMNTNMDAILDAIMNMNAIMGALPPLNLSELITPYAACNIPARPLLYL